MKNGNQLLFIILFIFNTTLSAYDFKNDVLIITSTSANILKIRFKPHKNFVITFKLPPTKPSITQIDATDNGLTIFIYYADNTLDCLTWDDSKYVLQGETIDFIK